PPRGDAVTFGYRPESVCLVWTCTTLFEYACRRTWNVALPRSFGASDSYPMWCGCDMQVMVARQE
ncbi:MAG: hypothetical protein KC940_03875, partial [Candidatus Omnitrophica bacterium]|nr:hypothetical protein [Candidatus Omnitrophota bacterium]